MITYGLYLMISVTPALAGVLWELRARTLKEFHSRQLQNPLARPRNRWQRNHLRYSSCLDCQVALERAVSRLVP